MEKIKLGISTCLLGENVRYAGGHKLVLATIERGPKVTMVAPCYWVFIGVCP